jgi:predicted acylesterase/phospholipase RssA
VTTTFERERDRHLFDPGPKRLLALDGGGVRGAYGCVPGADRVPCCASLSRQGGGPSRRLVRSHRRHFDRLDHRGRAALGYTTSDILRFYFDLAPKVFRRPFWRIMGLQAKFDADALRRRSKASFHELTLDTDKLITGLGVVTKRMDTGSPWILSNNPRAPYWEWDKGRRLSNLVRASTAAPFYLDPEVITVDERTNETGLFVDGGVTPHNNPSLVLFMMTVLKAFNIDWALGPDKLTIVSVGTGSHRDRVVPEELGMGRTAKLAIRALTSLMNDAQTFVLQQMQYLGECPAPWTINSEIGSLVGDAPPHGKLFRYLRYDVRLELPWIEKELGPRVEQEFGRKLTEDDVVRMRSMDRCHDHRTSTNSRASPPRSGEARTFDRRAAALVRRRILRPRRGRAAADGTAPAPSALAKALSRLAPIWRGSSPGR